MLQNILFIHDDKNHISFSEIYNYLKQNYKSICDFINDDIWFHIFSFINTDITSNFLINICMTNKHFNRIINERIRPIYTPFSEVSFWRNKSFIKHPSIGLKHGNIVFYNDGTNKCLAIVTNVSSTTKATIMSFEDTKYFKMGQFIRTYRRHMAIIKNENRIRISELI